MLSVKFGKRIE